MDLIVALLDRANWARSKEFVTPESIGKQFRRIVATIDRMYEEDPARVTIDPADLGTAFFRENTGLKVSDVEAYRIVIDGLAAHKVAGPGSLDLLIEDLVVREGLGKIQTVVIEATNEATADKLAEIGKLCVEYEDKVGRAQPTTAVSSFVDSDTVTEGAVAAKSGDVFRFPVPEIDQACGALDRGDFVVVAARVEIGKTSWIAQCVGAWAASPACPGRPIIVHGNEEREDKFFRRVMQAYFGVSTSVLLADFAVYKAAFESAVPKNRLLVTRQGTSNTIRELDKLFEEHNPCLIVVDQLDKVYGYAKAERDDLRLGSIYGHARTRWAATYGPVVAVSQLDALAEGQRYPGMAHLRGSKTDKPGEADLIITLGAADRSDPTRGVSLEKNKLDGADDALRHGKFELPFDKPSGRFLSARSKRP